MLAALDTAPGTLLPTSVLPQWLSLPFASTSLVLPSSAWSRRRCRRCLFSPAVHCPSTFTLIYFSLRYSRWSRAEQSSAVRPECRLALASAAATERRLLSSNAPPNLSSTGGAGSSAVPSNGGSLRGLSTRPY